jgi:bacteriorhodopsin
MWYISAIFALSSILIWRLVDGERSSGQRPIQDTAFMLVLVVGIMWFSLGFALSPNFVKSKNYHNSKSAHYKSLRKKFFFPGFSNGTILYVNNISLTHSN